MKIIIVLLFFSMSLDAKTFLVFGGKTGWIGQKFVHCLQQEGHVAICAQSRLENRHDIIAEIERVKPDFIINAAGITGRPNVDWCENHKPETIRTNVIGALTLIDVAYLHNIPVTNITTGCIYQYDQQHPEGSGIGFKETDEPNFAHSFYSKTKILVEKVALEYPNVLNLRVKMPVSSDMNPRSFVGKIISFEKVVNIPNSLSVLDELIPIAIEMTLRGLSGNYNFANPGALSHNEILDLYTMYVDPHFTYQNFNAQQQEVMSKRRSNCELDVSKLVHEFPHITPIKQAMINMFITVGQKIKNIN